VQRRRGDEHVDQLDQQPVEETDSEEGRETESEETEEEIGKIKSSKDSDNYIF